MNTTKAVFFDVDSTIYTHKNHDIPDSTKYTLQKLQENGYKVGIATSRCRYETRNLPKFFRNYNFDAEIYDGGALVMEHQTIVQKRPLRKEQVLDLISYAQKENVPVRYSTFDNDCLVADCSWKIKDEFFKLYLNMPIIKSYEEEEVFNLLAYPMNKTQEAEIHQLLHDAFIVTHSSSTLEITAKGIDKSNGVQAMADRWGITKENIICFGDGANDVGMLKAAGLGIAMGNGNPKAKEAADRICGHIDEDGVYHMCKELNLI